MDAAELNKLHTRLNTYEQRIESMKEEYKRYSIQERQATEEFEKERAKKRLEYKANGIELNGQVISKPTVEDIESKIRLDLWELYIKQRVGEQMKEDALKLFKMTETQISTIQSRLSFAKEEMKLV